MLNILNTVEFFGKILDWSEKNVKVFLIVLQAIILLFVILLIILLIVRRSKATDKTTEAVATTEFVYVQEPQVPVERVLMGISLDLEVVQREFKVDEEFNCSGLVVRAEYNLEPTLESLVDYVVVDSETYELLEKEDIIDVVYIIKPDMSEDGKKIVTVRYENHAQLYTIDVGVVEEQVEEEKQRELMYITLNTDNVQKEYTVGDSINHEGLIVTANYNVEPIEEEVTDYTVISPDMSKKGKPTVTVSYQDKTVGYQITVKAAQVVEQPKVIEEEPTVIVKKRDPLIIEEESLESRLRYDKSFTARLIQSDDDTKYWYTDLKNDLLSYKSVHNRISWKRETYKCHKEVIAKIAYRGKTMCIYLPLNPAEYVEEYPVEDASDMTAYEDTPMMIRLKSKRRVKMAQQLVGSIMEQKGIKRIEREAEDYYVPYEGIIELINRGLVRREIKTPKDEAIFAQNRVDDEVKEEESGPQKIAPGIYVTKKEN